MRIAKERLGKVKLSGEDLSPAQELGKDDLKRMIARLPDEDLGRQIRRSSPDLKGDKLGEVIKYITTPEHALRLRLTVDGTPDVTMLIRKSPASQAFRSAMRDLWKGAVSQLAPRIRLRWSMPSGDGGSVKYKRPRSR